MWGGGWKWLLGRPLRSHEDTDSSPRGEGSGFSLRCPLSVNQRPALPSEEPAWLSQEAPWHAPPLPQGSPWKSGQGTQNHPQSAVGTQGHKGGLAVAPGPSSLPRAPFSPLPPQPTG